MRTIGIGLLSAVGVLGPTIAVAQNAAPQQGQSGQYRQRVAQQRSVNWSGGQFGGTNGLSSPSNGLVEPGAYICSGFNVNLGVNCLETPFSFSGHPASYTIGPFLGYRYQLGDYVGGVEADWSWKHGTTSSSSYIPSAIAGPHSFRSDNFTGSVTQDWDSSFRVRYGYLVTPSTLAYATGGLAVGLIKGAFTYNGAILPPGFGTATSSSSWSDLRPGGTIGAGVETEVWQGWKFRAEYRYTDYGSYTKTVLCFGCGPPSSSASINMRESFQTIRIGLGFDLPADIGKAPQAQN